MDRALNDSEIGLGQLKACLSSQARQRLIAYGNGDGRALLTALEFVVRQAPIGAAGTRTIDVGTLDVALTAKALRYDKSGEEHYNTISAYIKSLRDSDADGALYWLARMLEAGEDPTFIARRMVIFASEDIGNADPLALIMAVSVAQPSSLSDFRRPRLIWRMGRHTSPCGQRIMRPMSDFWKRERMHKHMEI